MIKLRNLFRFAESARRPFSIFGHRQSAFTLAEILITLAVIGIVAALTIPALVSKYTEKATVTKVKKTYSLLQNAFQLAIIENGYPDEWNIGDIWKDDEGVQHISEEGAINMSRIFSKYLNTSKVCEGNMDCIGGFDLKLLNGDNYENIVDGSSSVILNDGIGVEFTPWHSHLCKEAGTTCASISIRTDFKNPAQYGINMFVFSITRNTIIPWGASSIPDSGLNSFKKKCVYNGGNFENGAGCTGWVIEIGNMDYLHCDGLSYGGKHKCD